MITADASAIIATNVGKNRKKQNLFVVKIEQAMPFANISGGSTLKMASYRQKYPL